MRVESTEGKSTFHRVTVPGEGGSFEIGPLTAEPATLYFNEFYSMLSKDKVKKK
jgi:hypothetical protein